MAFVREGEVAFDRPPPNGRGAAVVRGERPAILPPNIYGVTVIRGEDAPLVLLPPTLIAWPSSGRDAPATLPHIFKVAVVQGEDAPPDFLSPNLVTRSS